VVICQSLYQLTVNVDGTVVSERGYLPVSVPTDGQC